MRSGTAAAGAIPGPHVQRRGGGAGGEGGGGQKLHISPRQRGQGTGRGGPGQERGGGFARTEQMAGEGVRWRQGVPRWEGGWGGSPQPCASLGSPLAPSHSPCTHNPPPVADKPDRFVFVMSPPRPGPATLGTGIFGKKIKIKKKNQQT